MRYIIMFDNIFPLLVFEHEEKKNKSIQIENIIEDLVACAKRTGAINPQDFVNCCNNYGMTERSFTSSDLLYIEREVRFRLDADQDD